jgi:hypothetical protein
VTEQTAGGGDVSSAVVGSLCVLAPDFASYSDASGGPLTPGQVGVVVQVSTGRLQLRPQSGGDRVWWYVCVLQACWLLCVHVVSVGRRTWRHCASVDCCLVSVGTIALLCAWPALGLPVPPGVAPLLATAWSCPPTLPSTAMLVCDCLLGVCVCARAGCVCVCRLWGWSWCGRVFAAPTCVLWTRC